MSNSLQSHESQHARPPCPLPTPGVHSDSCPLSQWCHTAISSSVVPFSSCPQSLPASESFPMSQLFAWGGQSFSFSIIPSKETPGLISFRMDWLDLLELRLLLCPDLEKAMATHSSTLAWRIPRTGEPGGLPSMGSHRVGHDWSNLAAAEAACPDYCK